jgi:ApaG protein
MNTIHEQERDTPGASRGSDTLTEGLRVRVEPRYISEHSEPEQRRWIFAYHVHMANTSDVALTLCTRQWSIIDGNGEHHEVNGPGVVGMTPRIEPGASFEYESFCPLPCAWGTMEGSYLFCDDEGNERTAKVDRFYLTCD